MTGNCLISTAFISIADHATPSSIETGTAYMTRSVMVTERELVEVLYLIKEIGEDLRVEAHLWGQAFPNGDIRIEGVARIYEGTSYLTREPHNELFIVVLSPQNRLTSKSWVLSDLEGRKEIATVTVSFNNKLLDSLITQTQTVRRSLACIALCYLIGNEAFEADKESLQAINQTMTLSSTETITIVNVEKQLADRVKVLLTLDATVLTNGDIRISGDVKTVPLGNVTKADGRVASQRIFATWVQREQTVSRIVVLRNTSVSHDEKGIDVAVAFHFQNRAIDAYQ